MADKKEKDLTKVSDAAYIRALDSNGNPVLISKADLAQVAAELIGTATTVRDGLMPGSQYMSYRNISAEDFDDMLDKGVYIFSKDTSFANFGSPTTGYGLLEVARSGSYILQRLTFYSNSSQKTETRQRMSFNSGADWTLIGN